MSTLSSCKNDQNKVKTTELKSDFQEINIETPVTRKDTVSTNFFGTNLQDPYRWLEDDHSEETKNWVIAQNKSTFDYLDKIPFRTQLRSHIEKLYNYEKSGAPIKKGGKYYFFKNNGLQNQDILYVSES